MNDFQILGQTMDGYEEGIRERKENVLENIQLGTNRITGQIDLQKSRFSSYHSVLGRLDGPGGRRRNRDSAG